MKNQYMRCGRDASTNGIFYKLYGIARGQKLIDKIQMASSKKNLKVLQRSYQRLKTNLFGDQMLARAVAMPIAGGACIFVRSPPRNRS